MDLGTDLATMLQKAPGAVAVTIGAVSDYGVEDVSRYELSESGGALVDRPREILVRSGLFTITRGGTITVAGTGYTVRDWVAEDDGRVIRIVYVA